MSDQTIKLPLVPLRDMVVFPSMMAPFVVGRRASIQALEAMGRDHPGVVVVDRPRPHEFWLGRWRIQSRQAVRGCHHVELGPSVLVRRVEDQLLGDLYQRGIQSVIVEGGAVVLSEFIRRGLWQKMMIFVAPALIGGGDAPAIFSGDAVQRLTDAYRFRFDRVELVGGDLMITAYP